LFCWMKQDLAEIIEKGIKEQPPLPHSYNDTLLNNNE